MAELTNECCAPEARATCCEPQDKAECCGHDDGCGCAEFRKGYLEELPLDDASVDVVISNCVINL